MKKIFFLGFIYFFYVFSLYASSGQYFYGLIFGNSEYIGFNRLPNALNDARDLAQTIISHHYSNDSLQIGSGGVHIIENANRRTMIDEIIKMRNYLTENKNTIGFIWFAGHGVQYNGENYLIPVDFSKLNVDYLETDAISLTFLLNQLKNSNNNANIIVLDACRNNPLTRSRGGNRGLSIVNNTAIPQSSLVIFSTQANEEALDGNINERNSPFASAFINHINDETEFEQTFKTIARETLEKTNNQQSPTRYGFIMDDVYLFRRVFYDNRR